MNSRGNQANAEAVSKVSSKLAFMQAATAHNK